MLKKLILALTCCFIVAPNAVAQANGTSDVLRNIERSADQIAKTVQMKSMYAPNPNAAALMMSLNALKDSAKTARRYADGGDQSKCVMQISQLQVIAGNAVAVAQRAPSDSYTLGQLQMIQANAQQAMNFASMITPVAPPVYNRGFPPGYNGGGYPPYDGGYPYNGGMNPYNGGMNPYNPYAQPVNPYMPYQMGFAPGVLQATGNGRGQFSLMGQVLMGIKQASLSCMDPMSRKATLTISQGGAAVNLLGTVTAQTPSSATIAVSGSDRGPATGIITSTIGADGSLMSANGNGTMNGQPFVVSFRGN